MILFKKPFRLSFLLLLGIISCVKMAQKSQLLTIKENPTVAANYAKELREKLPIKLADGLQMSLWASDSLAPDPVSMSIDDKGRVYLTRTNRQKSSELDIRGHRDWMIESISFQTVEDRKAFLHRTFAPELSKKNEWVKDRNGDGSHDWKDFAVEKDEVWRLEDTDKNGMADVATQIVNDFYTEVSDIAGGILVRAKDMFVAIAPDLWRFEDKNGDGIYEKKTSISTGYQVHIGFSGHGMSGVTEGPDGRIYWNIGDIGASITTVDGRKVENPNSGFIARSNPDGSDFEIFATGLRNTHEFVFDEYGNLISSDNDGDHPGESERLVHVVEGSDAGWRSNWQYGKYTDPKNNKYHVWMDEKLFVPRWDGQAAYIMPPIMNYHNGPAGMQYNPGTALGSEWKNKFFLVEFVGTATRSHVWAFGLKPKGASFVLDGEKDIVSGILPTGIKFGPDGAMYLADWINGWGTKDYGRVWKLDVTSDKNDLAAQRVETQRLMLLNYTTQTEDNLYNLLFYEDMRIRQKAQFELVNRGKKGATFLTKALNQKDNQLARIHGIWGMGQLTRQNATYAATLTPLLKDSDIEIAVQAMRMLGDADIKAVGNDLIPFLTHTNDRARFYAAEALGQLKHKAAVEPLINLIKNNDDADVYIRHAGVLALSRIGEIDPILALANSPSKALRTAAILVLRRLKSEKIAVFLNDKDEYLVTETARAINDDLSIPAALPALAACLKDKKFTSEPLLRRAINAALRAGSEKKLDELIAFSTRTDIKDALKAEALATIATWADPSVLDRVDGRLRGEIKRDANFVKAKIQPFIAPFLKETNPETVIATASLLANLNITDANTQLAKMFGETDKPNIKTALLKALNQLKYTGIDGIIKSGMEDKDASVRTTALSLLNNSNVSKETLPPLVNAIFSKGTVKEQQQLLVVLGRLDVDKTQTILNDLIDKMVANKLSPNLTLELKEAIMATNSTELKAKMTTLQPIKSPLEDYRDALFGGNFTNGRNIFNYSSAAQCARCHAINTEGGNVGPNLSHIASTLTREQILEALIEPSARIAPGYGNIALTLKGGQEVFGILAKETATELTLTTSDAEPLVIAASRIVKRENMPSSMPPMGELLSKREIRDLVDFLTGLR
ncbi:MAG: HEAT repeat domain-containing protein [Saprospiraceae bacterium]|nr:HEAT repeat domain-containing protein [Saprospiraceae bacterium]